MKSKLLQLHQQNDLEELEVIGSDSDSDNESKIMKLKTMENMPSHNSLITGTSQSSSGSFLLSQSQNQLNQKILSKYLKKNQSTTQRENSVFFKNQLKWKAFQIHYQPSFNKDADSSKEQNTSLLDQFMKTKEQIQGYNKEFNCINKGCIRQVKKKTQPFSKSDQLSQDLNAQEEEASLNFFPQVKKKTAKQYIQFEKISMAKTEKENEIS